MSPHARWRNSKIVGPVDTSKIEELVGGLRNALERGEPLTKAKQSFLNAGYTTQEIQGAAQGVTVIGDNQAPILSSQQVSPQAPSQVSPQSPIQTISASEEQVSTQLPSQTSSIPQSQLPVQHQTNPTSQTLPQSQPKKNSPTTTIIILAIIGVIIIITSLIIGLFWNKIF